MILATNMLHISFLFFCFILLFTDFIPKILKNNNLDLWNWKEYFNTRNTAHIYITFYLFGHHAVVLFVNKQDALKLKGLVMINYIYVGQEKIRLTGMMA